jgi:phosphoribosylformylglycinamidine cyclo-ligase
MTFRYRDAGVDIDAANQAKARIKQLARATFNDRVLSEIGSFGGMFNADFAGMNNPVLVASCDGVGTKLKIAFATGIHRTIGYDLVSHCVDDILVQGARPLFFLDYIATGKLKPETVAEIVDGLARGCIEARCALLGGETAEMPGFYAEGEYDLAGFIVGIVSRDRVIDGSQIQPGDVVIGLPSVGLHTNGYSLARKLLLEVAGHGVDTYLAELGCTVGEELLKPHRNYLPALQTLIDRPGVIKGLAHITGGGLVENIPRILPLNVDVVLEPGSWPVLPVFDLLEQIGRIPKDDLLRTFNLGIGMVVIVASQNQDLVVHELDQAGEAHYLIGKVIAGRQQVRFEQKS